MKTLTRKVCALFGLEEFFGLDSFSQQCQKENSSWLFESQKELIVKVGQQWRSPLDYADKFCPPVFIEIKCVDRSHVTYLSNCSIDGSLSSMRIEDLKSKWVFVR